MDAIDENHFLKFKRFITLLEQLMGFQYSQAHWRILEHPSASFITMPGIDLRHLNDYILPLHIRIDLKLDNPKLTKRMLIHQCTLLLLLMLHLILTNDCLFKHAQVLFIGGPFRFIQ